MSWPLGKHVAIGEAKEGWQCLLHFDQICFLLELLIKLAKRMGSLEILE